jgi:O-antigen/teichoic acid export membrane protein
MSLARNTSITVAARLAITGAAAVSAVIVASTLGAKGAGVYTQARVIPHVIAALLGAGITIANPYLIGSRRYPVQAIASTSTAICLLLGALGFGAWAAAGGVLQARIYSELSLDMVLLVGLSVPLQLLCNYLNSIQQGLRTFKAANAVLLIEELTSLALLLPLYTGLFDGNAVIVASVLGSAAIAALASVVLLLRRGIRPWPRLHRAIAREAIVLGMKGHVGRIANMLNWRLDLMILSTMASAEVVGCYAVASKVAELFRPLSASLTFVLRPVIASLSVTEARAQGVVLYRRFFLINLAAIVVMAFTGGPLILYFFGPEFAPAIPAFQILLFGLAAHGADGVLNGYNVGIGKPEFNSYTALAGLVVTVIGDLALIPYYSLIGAAVASTVAYTVKAVTLTALFLATSGVTLRQLAGFEEYVPDAV